MTVLLIILAIIVLILIIPLGVRAAYVGGAFTVAVRVAVFEKGIFPAKEKPPKPEKEKKPRKRLFKRKPKELPPGEEAPAKKKLTPEELLGLARLGIDALSKFRRRLTINSFMLHFVAASEDPYSAAMLYGYVNSALGALMPAAERAFNVRRSDVRTAVDFELTEPVVDAEATVTINLARVVGIAISVGIAFLKLKIKEKRKRVRGEAEDERMDKDGTAVAAADAYVGDDPGEPVEN